MDKNKNWTLISALALMVSVLVLCGCGGHGHNHDEEAEDGHGHDHGHGDEIVLERAKAKAAGVVVETIEPGRFHGVIHTSGKVVSASCDETAVVAVISGRIGYKTHVSEGMKVVGGTTLFTITSAGMQVADGDPVQRSRIEFEKAERDYQRALLLIEDKIISEKDLAVAKAEYESAKLTLTSIGRNRSEGGVTVVAPKGGYIKQCLVSEGDYVETGQPLAVITQNQHLYLRAEVPERRLSELASIRCAKFRTSYSDRLYDITDMGGHVQSYGRSAEVENSFIPIIFEFQNTGDVVAGSYAEVYLITTDRENVISVPASALTEEQGVHYVYVQVDSDGYRKQEVSVGQSDGERVEILSGIATGDRVVTRGAVQVKLASAGNVIPAHTHNH